MSESQGQTHRRAHPPPPAKLLLAPQDPLCTLLGLALPSATPFTIRTPESPSGAGLPAAGRSLSCRVQSSGAHASPSNVCPHSTSGLRAPGTGPLSPSFPFGNGQERVLTSELLSQPAEAAITKYFRLGDSNNIFFLAVWRLES